MISQRKEIIQFYQENKIKQYNSFSGGFKYRWKPRSVPRIKMTPQIMSADRVYREFGVSKGGVKAYKLDNDYVPDTKQELADKLMGKIQHNLKKMRYYRHKYFVEDIGYQMSV